MLVGEDCVGQRGQAGMGSLAEFDRIVIPHGHGGQARGDRPPAGKRRVVAPEPAEAIQSPRTPQDVTVGSLARDPKLIIVIDKIVAT